MLFVRRVVKSSKQEEQFRHYPVPKGREPRLKLSHLSHSPVDLAYPSFVLFALVVESTLLGRSIIYLG